MGGLPVAPSALKFLKYETPPQPRQVRLDTVAYCNAKCVTCHGVNMKRARGKMNMDLIVKVLDDIGRWSKPLAEMVPVNYGEFFLLKKWFEILKLIEEKLPQTPIVIPTNGSLLDDDSLGKLLSVKTVKLLNFSINAYFKETYEAFTGLKAETIERIRDAILKIRYVRPDITIWASMVYDPVNQTEVERDFFIKAWSPLVNAVQINPTSYCDHPTRKPLIPVKTPCRSIFSDFVIEWDGRVSSCCFDANCELEVGNVKEQTILEIWHGEPFKRLRRLHNEGRRDEIRLCKECTFA